VNNKKKNILVWIFTWAALLLVVLYSPIGSPDLYSSSDYYTGVVPNANFSGSNIGSSPNFSESGSSNEINVPDYSSTESPSKLSTNYSSAASSSGNTSMGTASYSVSQSESYQNTQNPQGATGGGGSTFISNNNSSSKGSDASSAVTMTSGGVTTLSTDITTTSTTPKENALSGTTGTGNSGTDPGGDPTGPPIPVGDGWVFLLLLAASYGIIRKRFFAHS